MADIVSPTVRSRMMALIKAKGSKGERILRGRLSALGHRYRLHRSDLPGTPDMVFPAAKAVILFHGCFWHWHSCALFRMPKSNRSFWSKKLAGNVACDARTRRALKREGWRVLEVWECGLRGVTETQIDTLVSEIDLWLREGTRSKQLPFARRIAKA
jgi:DNA mismatch endonuclease, patch repair protein